MRVGKLLSHQHHRFVDEYLIDLNGSAAAVRAGYSAKSARVTASRLLTKANILEEVGKRFAAMQSRLEMNADDVRREFIKIIKDARSPAAGGPSVEAKISALDKLAKVLGMYTAKIHVTGTLTLEDLLLAADRKPAESQPGVTH